MLALLTDPNAWAALLTLTALEIILGVDNVIFLSLLAAGLEPAASRRARQIGLFLALIFRVAMLFGLTFLGRLRTPLFVIYGNEITWRDIISDRRRSLPDRQGHLRNSWRDRRRGTGGEAGTRRALQSFSGHSANRNHRSRLLDRLDLDRHRHGAAYRGDDRGRDHRDCGHVCGVRAGRRLHLASPDDQDAGAVVLDPDRRCA